MSIVTMNTPRGLTVAKMMNEDDKFDTILLGFEIILFSCKLLLLL